MRKLTSPDTQIREKRSPGDIYDASYDASYDLGAYSVEYSAAYSAARDDTAWHRSARFDGINFDLSDVEVKTS